MQEPKETEINTMQDLTLLFSTMYNLFIDSIEREEIGVFIVNSDIYNEAMDLLEAVIKSFAEASELNVEEQDE